MKTQGRLSGYKTYIAAGLGALGAIAAYFTGDATLMEAISNVMTFVTAGFLRNGVAKL